MSVQQIIWESTLDGVYECRVLRTGEYDGLLRVKRGTETLGTLEVALSYGAVFGPDVGDVGEWQEWCSALVDAQSKT